MHVWVPEPPLSRAVLLVGNYPRCLKAGVALEDECAFEFSLVATFPTPNSFSCELL